MALRPQENLLTSAYSILRRSGMLETAAGRRWFTSAYFLYKRYIEDDLQDLVRMHPALLRGGNALDVGANIGYTARLLARATDPGRKVFAFEPEAFNYSILQRIAADPEFQDKIVALQCAVGAENGTIDLWQNDRHPADHRIITDQFRSLDSGIHGVSVPLVSIDRFLEGHPGPVSFVKIDVQGYELPVCQGMQDTLEKNRDITVVLEYAPSAMRGLGFNPSHLISFLADRSFQVYLVRPKGKLSPGLPSPMEDSGYVDLLFRRRPIASGCEA
jgi:FkbM family methyltransferase